jgi:hypothetical protein
LEAVSHASGFSCQRVNSLHKAHCVFRARFSNFDGENE